MKSFMGRLDINSNAEPDQPSDLELITASRSGDADAFATLYARHVDAARRLARSLTRRRADVDDLVADAYTRVFVALQRGGGPDLAFRPYLYTTLRRIAIDRGIKGGHEVATEQPDLDRGLDRDLDSTQPFVDPALIHLERSMAAQAYQQLPERWQAVLWYTEVEEMAPNDVGELLGLSANATAALAYRAREGLRQAYLQVHLTTEPLRTCEPTIARLGAYVRGGVSERERSKVEEHLDECDRCRALYLELVDVNHGMRAFVAPLFWGVGAGSLVLKGGVVAWFGRVLPPRTPRDAAVVGGSAAAAVAVAVAVAVAFSASPSPVTDSSTTGRPAASTAAANSGTVPATSVGSTSVVATTSGTTTTAAVSSVGGIVSTTAASPTGDPPVTNATTIVPPTTTPTTVPPVPADLSVSMADVGALVAGRSGIVSVSVLNRGAGPGREVTVEVVVPPGVDVVPTSGQTPTGRSPARRAESCTNGDIIECQVGDVAPGADVVRFLRVSPQSAGQLEFSVRVRSSSLDAKPGDDSMTFATEVHDAGLSARWVGIGHLDVVATGNSNMSCPVTDSDCANAQRRLGGRVRNNQFEMVAVDVDGDPSTSNSSSADLALSGDVAFAGLYWGAERADAFGRDGVDLEIGGVRQRITAERVDSLEARYQSFADVTSIVSAGGSGRYTVANIATDVGTDHYAGWALIVVTRADVFTDRSVAIFDGLLGVETGVDAHATIGGFRARAGGAVRVGLVVYEGDAGTDGDAVRLDGQPIGDAANPSDDVMNSTVSSGGRISTERIPTDSNTFGVDVDVLDASGKIASGATKASLDFTTDGDVYLVGAAVAVVDR